MKIQKIKSLGLFVFSVLISIPSLFVFYWMISVSLKTDVDSTAYPPAIFNFIPTFAAYERSIFNAPFVAYVTNSLIIAIGTVVIGNLIGLPAAYCIVRWNMRKLSVSILVTRMIPAMSFIIPWFLLFKKVGLIDTYTGLIMAQLTIALPMMIWLMIGFFIKVPKDLHEAARIDGCTEISFFWRIMVPLASQGVAASSIIAFIYTWNNFLFPVILAGRQTKTLPVAVFSAMSFQMIDWSGLAAMATIVTLPVLIIFLFTQKYIVIGLTSGSVKG